MTEERYTVADAVHASRPKIVTTTDRILAQFAGIALAVGLLVGLVLGFVIGRLVP